MESKITLDSKAFKALAADTRVSILKHLKSRRYTQSELAELLDLKVPSVKEHLLALEKAELVNKIEEGRKWKYYELTSKARAILDPERKQILITLVVFLLSAVGSIYLFFKNLLSEIVVYDLVGKESAKSMAMESQRFVNETSMFMDKVMAEAPKLDQKVVEEAVPYFAQQTRIVSEPNYWIYVFIIVAIISLIFLVYFLVRRKKVLRLLP